MVYICKQTRLLHSCQRFNGGFSFSFFREKISMKVLNIFNPDIHESVMYKIIVL